MVKLPEAERSNLHDVETLLLRTEAGGSMPLNQADAALNRLKDGKVIGRIVLTAA